MLKARNLAIHQSLTFFAILFSLLGGVLSAYADIYERPNKHVIISFDTAVPKFASQLRDRSFMENHLQPVLDQLDLSEEDYISLVNFGISKYSQDLRELGRAITDGSGKAISWVPYTSLSDVFSKGASWSDMIEHQGIFYTVRDDAAFSLLTGSKPYTLLSQHPSENSDKVAGETYLIMVTDDNYNGCDDINKEFSQMAPPNMSAKDFLDQCRLVASYYNFYYDKDLSDEHLASFGDLTYKAMVFKVLPSSNMALSSVVDYPANLGMKRVRGGYALDFDFQSADKDYLIRRLEVHYTDNKGQVHSDFYTYRADADEESNPQHINLFIPNKHIDDNKLDVQVKGWLQQKDDVYGAALLNPNSSDFQRLNVSTTLSFKNEAKAFGFLPIPDFLWLGNNVSTQIQIYTVVWALIIIVLFYLLYHWLAKKYSTYVPKNEEISMYMREAEKGKASSQNKKNQSSIDPSKFTQVFSVQNPYTQGSNSQVGNIQGSSNQNPNRQNQYTQVFGADQNPYTQGSNNQAGDIQGSSNQNLNRQNQYTQVFGPGQNPYAQGSNNQAGNIQGSSNPNLNRQNQHTQVFGPGQNPYAPNSSAQVGNNQSSSNQDLNRQNQHTQVFGPGQNPYVPNSSAQVGNNQSSSNQNPNRQSQFTQVFGPGENPYAPNSSVQVGYNQGSSNQRPYNPYANEGRFNNSGNQRPYNPYANEAQSNPYAQGSYNQGNNNPGKNSRKSNKGKSSKRDSNDCPKTQMF